MRTICVMTAAILLAAMGQTCQKATAFKPLEDVGVQVDLHESGGPMNSCRISWNNYRLSLLEGGSRCTAHVTKKDPVTKQPLSTTDLLLEQQVPQLDLNNLPSDIADPMRVAVELAQNALYQEKTNKRLTPGLKRCITAIAERRFYISEDAPLGEVSFSWNSRYIGGDQEVTLNYKDASASLVLGKDSHGLTAYLQKEMSMRSPEYYSVNVTSEGSSVKILVTNIFSMNPPTEDEVRILVHDVISRINDILAVKQYGAPPELVQAVVKLEDRLKSPVGISSYKMVTPKHRIDDNNGANVNGK
jgi:hypothetical protein